MPTLWSDIEDRLKNKAAESSPVYGPQLPTYGPPSPVNTNPFVRPQQSPTVKITEPNGQVFDRNYGFLPVQPVVQPQVTINKPQDNLSLGKFVAKAGVAAVSMAVDSMRFVADYLGRHSPLEIQQKLNPTDPILGIFKTDTPQGQFVAEKWKQLVSPIVAKGDEQVASLNEKLKNIEYIQPSEGWKNATWQDRFSRENLGETLFNLGADVAGSVAGFAINPTFGFATSAGSTAQGLKEMARENGVDENTSDKIAIGTGLVVGLIDKIVPDEVLKPFTGAFSKRLGSFIFRAVKTGAKESATEVVQEDIQMLAEVSLRHDLTLDEFVSRNVMSALGGVLGGSGMRVIADTVNAARSEQKPVVQPPNTPAFKVAPVNERTSSPVNAIQKNSVVYHGTPNVFEGKPNFPFYLTTDKEYAKVYEKTSASSLSTNRKSGRSGVMEFNVSPDARILDLRTKEGKDALKDYWSTSSVSGEQVKTETGLPDWIEGENIAQFIDEQNLPFDAVLLDEGGVPSNNGVKSRGIAFQALNDKAIIAKDTILKYKRTLNVQNKSDAKYLTSIFGEERVNRFKEGDFTDFRGNEKEYFESIANANIVSETPKTPEQELEGRITERRFDNRTVFHGTSAQNTKNILKNGFKRGSELSEDAFRGGGYGAMQDSISFSINPKIASSFTGSSNKGVLFEVKLKDGVRIVEVKGIDYAEDLNDYIDVLKKQGIDGVYLKNEEEVVIFDASSVEKIISNAEFTPSKSQEDLKEVFGKFEAQKQSNGSPFFIKSSSGYRLVSQAEAAERVAMYKKRLKLDNLEVQLVDAILTDNGTAFASSFGNTITLTEGLPQFAADHEIIHSLMRNMDKLDIFKNQGITRDQILDEARQRYGDIGDVELEERVAENFELYVEARINKQSTSWMGKMADFFEMILKVLDRMFGLDNSLATTEFFEWVYGGKQSMPVTLRTTNIDKYTRMEKGNVIVDFSKIEFARFKEMTPEDYVNLQELLKEKRTNFRELGESAPLEMEIAANLDAQNTMRNDVVSGIKNSTFFKKEGDIQDIMGEGYLLKRSVLKNKGKPYMRYVIVPASEKNAMVADGYSVVGEVDSIASANGFDSGYEYLQDQLRLSRLETSLEKRIDEHLYNTDPQFKNAKNKLENYRKMVRGETVTVTKYMHDVGIIERTKDRRVRVSAVQKFFGFSDGDMKRIRGNRDVSTMTSGEFDEYMYKLEERAVEYAEVMQKRAELVTLINQKELSTFENLRQAMKLPPIKDMTIEQMAKFESALAPYQRGDVFLPVRKLETIDKTKLEGMKTIREVREALSIEADVPLSDLENVQSGIADYVRYDVNLAEQNPLYKVIVENVTLNQVSADVQLVKVMNEFYELVKDARRSQSRTVADRLIPQDKKIVSWLEADPENKKKLEKEMTPEELKLASFMRTEYGKIRDYLVKQQVIEKGIENYYTHIRRGFLETVKDDGLVKAFKEVFRQNEQDEITFKIIDDDTGTILPLEKFFSFSLKRTGGLVPTQNVARSFEQYLKTFYKKVALDSTVPLIDIYVYSLEPKQTTETGLQMDRSLRKFVNEWLNNKRGRKFSFGGVLKQGGRLDTILRFGKAFTTFLDLGFNLATGIASAAGEQTMVYKGIGAKKHALGVARLATQKGREMTQKYESVTGRGVFDELFLPSKDIGDQLLGGAMVLFSASSKIANNVYFLGVLTDEEFSTGEVSEKRLAEMKLDIGRWRPVAEFKSIVGSTSAGQVGTQYKTWLIPIVTTTLKNWTNIAKMLKNGKNPIRTREFQEEFRGVLLITLVYLLFAGNDDEDESFIGTLKKKVTRELFTSIGALSPAAFLATPRLVSFVEDMRDGIQSLITLERYKTTGELKGIETLKRIFTPKSIQQFIPKSDKSSRSSRGDSILNDMDSDYNNGSRGDAILDSIK